jgi:uncharacterized membrane protein
MTPGRTRVPAIDALRGVIMIIMALDHVRDFFHAGAMTFRPDDLSKTTPAIFFTRWITHFCAPVFMLTAGMGAAFWLGKPGRTKKDLSRFLISRGLWLIVLEFTVLRFGYFLSLTSSPWLLTILWALGWSMIALAAFIHVPTRVLVPLCGLVIVGHNMFDSVKSADFGAFGPLWTVLHAPGAIAFGKTVFFVGYALVPWIAVMALGYAMGPVFALDPVERRRRVLTLGLALTAGFVLLRALNVYGDPFLWSNDPPDLAVLSFLRTNKYPPSLLFLLMTLGPALVVLSWFDRISWKVTNPLVVIGRVPLFFFIVHFYVAHFLLFPFTAARYGHVEFLLGPLPSMGGAADTYPAGFGYTLLETYGAWALVLLISYPLCVWFARVKERRSDWWLSYL